MSDVPHPNGPESQALRIGVVGTGYLGRFHAQKYHQLPGCELLAIADSDAQRAADIAAEFDTQGVTSHHDLVGLVDAVSVASPTQSHFGITRDLLKAGIHVLVEKPMTVTVAEGEELVALATERGLTLQVGHLERFNPALLAVEDRLADPVFIESHRLAPFTSRGADVNVVLDLMIHDIDIILHLVRSEVIAIHANGARVVSDQPDIANVRLEFENGCVANVTASRVSGKRERRMRFFQKDLYIAVDFQENTSRVCHVNRDVPEEDGVPPIDCVNTEHGKGDAILAEIRAFCSSVRHGSRPMVSGEDGLRALGVANSIGRQLLG